MPFHAAGNHEPGSVETAYHTTVSSYASSIKMLAYAQTQVRNKRDLSDGSLMIVTMPTTPSLNGKPMPSLPGAIPEKDALLRVSEGHVSTQHMGQPSAKEVLDALEHSTVAHFACHGSTDPKDPSSSALILQRESEGIQDISENGGDEVKGKESSITQDRLTVKMVSEVNLPHARLGYLSACSTAQNKAKDLADEAIHVVSGFQVAGFPHVVGCLWPSNDRVCVEIASKFYEKLFGHEKLDWDSGVTAEALREAVMVAREDDLRMPLNWAQFVHYGP